MATKGRSPQYPAFGLGRAIELVRKIHARVHRHKASPLVLVNAVGYTSMNGKSITALSTLKKYELLEEQGTELKVTKTALTILFEPANTPAWKEAMKRAALAPTLFSKLCHAYPGSIPQDELVRSYLLQNGFLVNTVDMPVRAFRDTMALVKGFLDGYNDDNGGDSLDLEESDFDDPLNLGDKLEIEIGDLVQWESGGTPKWGAPRVVRDLQDGWAFVEGIENGIPMEELVLEKKATTSPLQQPLTPPRLPLPVVATQPQQGEKEWLRGPLSKGASYRLIVSGDVGPKEIGKLIKLLEAQKEVLDDDAEEEPSFSSSAPVQPS